VKHWQPSTSTALTLALAVAALVAVGAGLVLAQDDAASAPQTIFFKANTHYHDGAYDQAAREYERLLASGFESGNLLFNLGNSYFKLGDLGRAIANYERAARFMPADPDLIANLAYARSLTGAEACEVPVWRRAAFPLRGRMSTSSLVWVVSALWTLTFVALMVYRLVSQARSILYVAAGLAALTLISGISLADQLVADEWPRQAVVIGVKEQPARFEPAEDGTVHFSLREGSKVEVTEERQGWLQVSRCDGRRGWVPASALELL